MDITMKNTQQTTKYPKISIVTPSYNQGKFIERTIQSVISQNYPNLEYIVVDGGSTDETIDILKKYSHRLTHWVSEPDRGQADALNKGFSQTSGDIMTWINSDDVFAPGSLHLVGDIFRSFSDVDWISGIPNTIDETDNIVYVGPKQVYVRSLIRHGLYHGGALGFIMQEGTFWRRRLWQQSGCSIPKKTYSLDFELWRRFATHAYLTPVDTILASYRLNPDRKNRDNHASYYQELSVHHPTITRALVQPPWRIVRWICAKLQLFPRVYYLKRHGRWCYTQGRMRDPLLRGNCPKVNLFEASGNC